MADVTITIDADADAARKELAQLAVSIEASVDSIGSALSSVGGLLVGAFTAPLAGITTAAVKAFADVESAVANISTIKPEINISQVLSALNELSTKVPQTAEQLGAGLYDIFSSFNVGQEQALELLEKFSKGAAAAQTDTQTFSSAILGIMNAYSLGVESASKVSDVFFNTVNLGVVSGAELATSLGVATSAAKTAGVGFEELGALIVGVTKEGGAAAQNINNLANFLNKFTSIDAQKDLKKIFGVDVIDKATGSFKSMVDILAEIKPKYDELSESAKSEALQKIFPDVQARQGAAVLLSQLDNVKEALKINQESAGAAEAAFSKIQATLTVQGMLLKNSAIAIFSELGSVLAPFTQEIVGFIAQIVVPFIKQIVESFKTLSPTFQTIIVAAGAVLSAIGPIALILGTIISYIAPLIGSLAGLAGAFSTVGAAITSAAGFVVSFIGLIGEVGLAASVSGLATVFGGILTSGITAAAVALGEFLLGVAAVVAPIIAIGIAIAGVAATIYGIWVTDFGGLKTLTLEVFEVIKNTVSSAVSSIYQIVVSIGNQIYAFWQENQQDIKQVFETVSNAIRTTIQTFLDAVRSFWEANGKAILANIADTYNLIKDNISSAIKVIADVIKLTLAVINGDSEKAWKLFQDLARDAFAAAVTIVKNGITFIGRALAALVPLAVEYAVKFSNALGEYLLKGIIAAGLIIATLPQRIITAIPALIRAGVAVGVAVWEGIKRGLASGAAEAQGWIDFSNGMTRAGSQTPEGGTNADNPKVSGISGKGLGSAGKGAKGSGKSAAEKTEDARKKRLDDEIKLAESEEKTAKTIFDGTTKNLENLLKSGELRLDEFKGRYDDAISLYYNDIIKSFDAREGLINQRFSGTEQRTELEKLRQARKELGFEVDDKTQSVGLDVRERKIKNKEIEAKQSLDLEKSRIDDELSENQRLLDAKQKNETQFAVFKEQKAKELLEIEKQGVVETIAEIARIYRESGLSADDLRNTEKFKDLDAKRKQLDGQITSKGADVESVKNEAGLKAFLEVEKEKESVQKTRNEAFYQSEQRKYEVQIRNGKNVAANLRGLRDLELTYLNESFAETETKRQKEESDRLKSVEGVANEEEAKHQIRELYKQKELLSKDEFEAKKKEIEEKYNREKREADSATPFGTIVSGIGDYLRNVLLVEDANGRMVFSFSQMFQSIGEMGVQAFASLAQGFGQMVAGWVLGTDKGSNSLRKLAANILAQVASMATTYAIMSLGAAALASTVFGAALLGGTPAQFLTAAAIFGSIAAVTAVAGRAVAGDEFSNQSAQQSFNQSTNTNNPSQVTQANQQAAAINQDRLYSQDRDRLILRAVEGLDRTLQAGIPVNFSGELELGTNKAQDIVEIGSRESYSNGGYIARIYKNAANGSNSPDDY